MNNFNSEEFEDFLEKVNEVKAQIDAISKGVIDEKKIEATQQKFNAKKVYKEKLEKIK